MKVKLLSRVRLFATAWTVDYQAAPSTGFSRKIPQAAGCGHKPTNQPKQTNKNLSAVPQSSPHFTWFWRRLLRVPWTARSNQSILKDSIPEYSLEGLKLQYFGHLMRTADSVEKCLMLGKIEDRRRRGRQRMR